MNDPIYCLVCRKPVRAGSPMALLRIDQVVFGPDHANRVPPSWDQGWFEVGPDCYKRILRAGPRGVDIVRDRSKS